MNHDFQVHCALHPLHIQDPSLEQTYLEEAKRFLDRPQLTVLELLANPRIFIIDTKKTDFSEYHLYLLQRYWFWRSREFFFERAKKKGLPSSSVISMVKTQEEAVDPESPLGRILRSDHRRFQ